MDDGGVLVGAVAVLVAAAAVRGIASVGEWCSRPRQESPRGKKKNLLKEI
jgi:hypothetical protein